MNELPPIPTEQPTPEPTAVMRRGVAVTASPLTVTVGGSLLAVPARHLRSYWPTVGDVVQIIEQSNDLLVLGPVGPDTSGEWTPRVSQPGLLSVGTAVGRWVITGGIKVDVWFSATPGSSGTAGNRFGISGWPAELTPDSSLVGLLANGNHALGKVVVLDAGVTRYEGSLMFGSTSMVDLVMQVDAAAGAAQAGAAPSFAVTSGTDTVGGHATWLLR